MEQSIITTRIDPVFILIDDDYINNHVCQIMIRKISPDANVSAFTDPEEAVRYFQKKHEEGELKNTILFLDINMPVTSGWEVLGILKSLFADNSFIRIYMLSSSVDPADIEKSRDPYLSGYIEKPMTLAKLEAILQA